MSESLIIDWLNENELRAYPLQDIGSRAVTSSLSLDQIILDASLVFPSVKSSVKLQGIQYSGDTCVIQVEEQQAFIITSASVKTYPYYCRNSAGSLLVVSSKILEVPYSKTFTTVFFEPSVCHFFPSEYSGVSSLSFNGAVLTGQLVFSEGYQTRLSTDGVDITVGANMNYGLPLGCVVLPESSTQDCSLLVKSINSVGGGQDGNLQLYSGDNVRIFEDYDNHRLYVGLNFEQSDICPNVIAPPLRFV